MKIDPQMINDFRETLCQSVLEQKNVTQLQPELKIDIEVALAQLAVTISVVASSVFDGFHQFRLFFRV